MLTQSVYPPISDDRAASEQRRLRLILLDEIANTGRILALARAEIPTRYQRLLRRHGITRRSAAMFIEVYQKLEPIKLAEQWHHDRGGQTPTTAEAALRLLARWQCHRH